MEKLEHAPSSVPVPKPVLPKASIRQQLDRILASSSFLNARRPSQFLRFVVESTLSGQADTIKEYLIGVEVFDRPVDYDPKDDPIVRIEAGRLRKKLAEYYSGPGANDPVKIDLPKGGYVPVFQPRSLWSHQPQGTEHASEQESAAADNGDLHRADVAEGLVTSLPSSSQTTRERVSRMAATVILLAAVAVASVAYVRLRSHSTPASIAVLPFLDLREGHPEPYLSDGMAEELTTGMAQFNGLRVVAATSAFQFRGKSEDVRKIGQALGADALLEGSISQSANSLRVNAQLIDARNGYHLWSKAYDVHPDNILASEQEIVLDTAHALHVSANSPRPLNRDTESSEAHDLYLRGRYLWHTRQLPDMLQSIQLFQHAIQDDPNYALAYAGLADTYTVMAINTQMAPAEAIPLAKAALQRAIELDPDSAQVHATWGLLKSQCEWDWHGAEQEFRKAIELDSNYAPAHHWAALEHMYLGQFDLADAEFRKAQVLDPMSPMITEGRAENFKAARRYDDAINIVLNMPDKRVAWQVLAQVYTYKGMYQEALNVPGIGDAADLNGLIIKAGAMAGAGHRAEALRILEDFQRNHQNSGASNDYIPPGVLAYGYASISEKEQAFTWLEKAYQVHDPALAYLKVDPIFDSLRSDPRYADLLRKVGLSD
jgi:adenylate cyclase